MSTPQSIPRSNGDADTPGTPSNDSYYPTPTYAAFSSSNLSTAASAAKRTSTILVHQKSPLLLATPPQITRALAYSHPFLLPLNKLAGLLSWTSGDPWESFLLVALYWATVLYGDVVIRWAGPIVMVLFFIGGLYARRYSPLSSSGWTEPPTSKIDRKASTSSNTADTRKPSEASHQRNTSEATNTRHQKTLDEIVETVKVFTTRCNILLEPLLEMTDFLSTQRTATSATTKPALTALFTRIVAVTPFWIALTLPPWRIITTKRVALFLGTVVLTWHSRACRVVRTLLWRSATVRKLARWVTGLHLPEPVKAPPGPDTAGDLTGDKTTSSKEKPGSPTEPTSALTAALQRSKANGKDAGVRFTFIIYENQRRWVGLGWTSSLMAYERSAWTDEHMNPVPPKNEFELPEVEDGHAKWRWVEDSKWRVDGVPDVDDEAEYDGEAGKNGWIYYDNKWQNGRRGVDGWGRWTRRRKWYRDAELVEVEPDQELERRKTNLVSSPPPPELPMRPPPAYTEEPVDRSSSMPETTASSREPEPQAKDADADSASILSSSSKSTRFRLPGSSPSSVRRKATGDSKRSRRTSEADSLHSVHSVHSVHEEDEGALAPGLELEIQGSRSEQATWGVGDEVKMGLE